MNKESLPYLELFGRCTHGHRARLVYYDRTGRNQEPYVHVFAVGAGRAGPANVYRVTCPECGEEYTTLDSGVERKES
jgi:hypothetical protein